MAIRSSLTSLVSRITKTARAGRALKTRASGATTTVVSKARKTAVKATKVGTATKASKAARATKATKAGKPVGKRTRIDTTPSKSGGSRYVRRDSAGHFTSDQVSVGKSLAADRRSKAKTKATKGNKDRGD